MTPVHLSHNGGTIGLIGLTLSLHLVGMFALAPVVGAVADRYGAAPVIVAGHLVLVLAVAVGVLGAESYRAVTVALVLLGLGWSVVTVPASTLLTLSVRPASRPLVQGTSDAVMNGAAALGAIASGPLLALVGFRGLAVAAASLVAPALWAARRPGRRGAGARAPAGRGESW